MGSRLASGKVRWSQVALDVPLAVFALSALLGAWASYRTGAAWDKFWLLLGGVFLFYALDLQRLEGLQVVARALGGIAALAGMYFLFSHDWSAQPADLHLLNQVGLAWMQVRPFHLPAAFHPNLVGGWIAAFAPFLALWASQVNRRSTGRVIGLAALVALAGLALLMTSSRASWLALASGLGLWGLWEASVVIHKKYGHARQLLFLLLIAIFLAILAAIVVVAAGGPVRLAGLLPGPNSSISRLDIARHTVRLIADFPLTGGGLRSFPGLYSHYMIVMPYFLFDYAHNLYLDIALEQGLPGLMAMLWIYFIAGWLLYRTPLAQHLPGARLRQAIAVATFVLLAHGLVDDAFYGMHGTPLLFVLPAMAAALHNDTAPWQPAQAASAVRWRTPIAAGLLLLIVTVSLAGARLALPGTWRSNLASIQMARIELAGFPPNAWRVYDDLRPFEPIRTEFDQALAGRSGNRTALHRLGLLAMMRQDYAAASITLLEAYALDPDHRGVIKNLGYSLAWQGDLEHARLYLVRIPEAAAELRAYVHFWQSHDRPDLAERSSRMAELLKTP